MPAACTRKNQLSAKQRALDMLMRAEIEYYDHIATVPIEWGKVERLRRRADRIRHYVREYAVKNVEIPVEHADTYREAGDQ